MPLEMKNWVPTTDKLAALPLPLRRYIRDLQRTIDPAGLRRENLRLREENAALLRECERLAAGASQRK